MQVHYIEGVAIHSGPESCVGIREGVDEALTGVRAGQPLSRDRVIFWAPTRLETWKATRTGARLQAPGRPGVVEDPGMCGSSLYGNREISRLASRNTWAGSRREGEEP